MRGCFSSGSLEPESANVKTRAKKPPVAKITSTTAAKTAIKTAAKIKMAKLAKEAAKPVVSTAQRIESDADVAQGVKALRRACAHMRKAHDLAGSPPLRRRSAGFEGLARIIVGQQVSVASANAIWARFAAAVVPMTAASVLARTDDELRGAGLSRPKIRTLRAISQAVVDGLHDDDVHTALTAISGIGPWTADIFLMFCLGRADTFASGDLALQIAAHMLMDLDERPGPDELLELAERWRPWRSVAARLLWAYYAAAKAQKSSAVPV
jgi:DNA-3-methyladenine glycosylase II